MFGTAVHETLKTFFDKWREEDDMKKNEILALFENNLNKHAFSDSDLAQAQENGVKALGGYYDTYKKVWPRNILNEFKIRGVLFKLEFKNAPEIRLTGNLDKIEILNTKGECNVVDYKTGKPRSRGEILGKTKNSNGDYKRQLVFYNLLLDSLGASGAKF